MQNNLTVTNSRGHMVATLTQAGLTQCNPLEKTDRGRNMRTKQAMATNAGNKSNVIYPKELAAPDHELKNPPPVAGLKILAALIDAAGDAVTLDQYHELPAAALRAVPGISGYSVDALNDLLETLTTAQIKLHDPERRRYSFGPILSHAVVGYAQDRTVQSCRFMFGPAFREMVEKSDIYAILDRATLYALSSRYAVLFYQFLATHWRKKHQNSVELSLVDLRRILAVEKGSYPEFKHLNDRTIKPSLKLISELSPWTVTAQQLYSGEGRKRSVDRVRISWERKSPLPLDVAQIPAPKKSTAKPAATSAAKVADLDPLAALKRLADRINSGQYIAATEVSAHKARQLLQNSLTTLEQLKQRGIQH